MEENKLSSSELEKLVKIYYKLEEIDGELYDVVDNSGISNDVRDGIIDSMEKIRHILNKHHR